PGGRGGGGGGPTAPAVYNAANEIAVAAFLEGRITFGAIVEIIERVLQSHDPAPATTVEDVRAADQWARARAHEVFA
ncbi:MAG: hypothetical protein V3T16_08565, partial [Gemmatimonadales bacterium]